VKDRTAAKNPGKDLALSLLKRQNGQRLDQIERQIAAIEAAMRDLDKGDADLSARFAILTGIPGVSAITAFALLLEMPELGTLEAGEAASLAGLAPSPASRVDGRAAPSSAEVAPAFKKPSTCPGSSRCGSIRISKPNIASSSARKTSQKSQSLRSCESSSSSPMRSSKPIAIGSQKPLDHHGYSN